MTGSTQFSRRTWLVALTLALAVVFFALFRHPAPEPGRDTDTLPIAAAAAIAPPGPAAPAVETWPNPDRAATDDDLLVLARKYAAVSPQRAVAWARSQSDADMRRRLLAAVLRAWGEGDPDPAIIWVLAQDETERPADMEAVLAGAVRQPSVTLAMIRQLLADDPEGNARYGAALIVALSNAGEFDIAIGFLNEAPADSRRDWTTATFERWGAAQPRQAMTALDSLTDEALRETAFRAVVNGWNGNDPAGLANYAVSLPEGTNRSLALGQAMDNWSLQDPAGLAEWLNSAPRGVDFDQAIAAIISRIDGANCPPELAAQWVENISDPRLRYDSLAKVLGDWSQTDPAAAADYVKNLDWLNDQQRSNLLARLPAAP